MAKASTSKKGPASGHRARLKSLPCGVDVWQVAIRPVDMTLSTGKPLRRWITVAVSEAKEAVVAITFGDARLSVRGVWEMLAGAMLDPEDGCPCRPSTIQVRTDGRLRGLGPLLRTVDITLFLADELDLIDDLFEQLNEDHDEVYDRSLLDMPGVIPRMVKSAYRSAAAFYRRAPWRMAGNGVVRVDCPARADDPWFAAVTGRSGTTPGLVLSKSQDTVERIRQGNLSDKRARTASALAIVFGRKKQMIEADLEMVQQYKLPIAGPRAFPLFFRQEAGTLPRPPYDLELQLLDGCLRALPRLLAAGDRSSARPIDVKVAGEVKLVMRRI